MSRSAPPRARSRSAPSRGSPASLRGSASARPALRPPLPPGPYVVAGVGRAGVAAIHALVRSGEAVRAWDGLGHDRQRRAIERLAAEGIATHDGEGGAALDGPPPARTLVKSPGLPMDAPVVATARARGLTVLDEAELGWRLDARPFIAITGTNGKSTTTALVSALLEATGRTPVAAGNTRFGVPLSDTATVPGDCVVAELSSFQLEGCVQLRPDAAVLTNVTRDHVYRHGSMDAYAACKRRLFYTDDGTPVPAAAVGIDEPAGRALAADLARDGARVVTFGRHERADRRVLDVASRLDGSRVVVTEAQATRRLDTRLPGEHNALNVAAALALGDALGIDADLAAATIAATPGLPGRFERVAVDAEFAVVVDFAHNPAGVAETVGTARAILREHGGGMLHVVLSALSIVDHEHARGMAAAARAGADRLILTTQRWSPDEASDAITVGLREGAAGVEATIEPDRGTAIAGALADARPGDLVLVLDRGENDGPLYGVDGVPRRFDDRDVVRALLSSAAAR